MALLAGEAEGLTRKAVEAALAGDPMALRLCVECILPRCPRTASQFCTAADRERRRYRRGNEGGDFSAC